MVRALSIFFFILFSVPSFAIEVGDAKLVQHSLFDCIAELIDLDSPVSGLKFSAKMYPNGKAASARFTGEHFDKDSTFFAEARQTDNVVRLTYLTHSDKSGQAINREEVTPVLLDLFSDYDQVEVKLSTGALLNELQRMEEKDPYIDAVKAKGRGNFSQAISQLPITKIMAARGFTKVEVVDPPKDLKHFDRLHLVFRK